MLAALELQELRQDLKSFGLNPQDWKIIPESEGCYIIESDDDEDFIFLGTSQNMKWERIEILSL